MTGVTEALTEMSRRAVVFYHELPMWNPTAAVVKSESPIHSRSMRRRHSF